MNTKTTITIVGAVVAMSLVANAVMARQAGAGKPRQEFKGPVKAFILAGQSNMEGHAGVQTLDRLGEHPTYGYRIGVDYAVYRSGSGHLRAVLRKPSDREGGGVFSP